MFYLPEISSTNIWRKCFLDYFCMNMDKIGRKETGRMGPYK